MTLMEFARALDIYDDLPDGMLTSYFKKCEVHSEEFNHAQASSAWEVLAPGVPYMPSRITASSIPDTRVRCLHRLVANTINYRKESNEKVSNLDIWFLDRITRKKHVHIPHMLLRYLYEDKFEKAKSPLVGGHFVTLIAEHLGMDFQGLERLEMAEFGRSAFISAKILQVVNNRLRRYGGTEGAGSSAAAAANVKMPKAAGAPEGGDAQYYYGQWNPQFADVISRLGEMQMERRAGIETLGSQVGSLSSQVHDVQERVTRIEHNQGWGNYRDDWVQYHHMHPNAPMDLSYQQPQYYDSAGTSSSAPVYQYHLPDTSHYATHYQRRTWHQQPPQHPDQDQPPPF